MIIGLTGYATAGKSAAAAGLEPMGFVEVAFADKLRKFLYTLNPIVHSSIKGVSTHLVALIDEFGWQRIKETEYGSEVRRLLQVLGTDCGRNLISDTVWIDATLDNLSAENVVVSDVRFPNEAQAIIDRGGCIVRVERPGVKALNDHPSETSMDSWEPCYTIINDGAIEELQITMREVAWLILGQPKLELSKNE